MNRSFKIGDQVAWIDEDLQGNVISIKKNTIVVETSDGFEIEAQVGELVLLPGKESFKVDWNELQRTKQNELKSKKTYIS